MSEIDTPMSSQQLKDWGVFVSAADIVTPTIKAFHFIPGQRVRITLLDLNHEGIIQRCSWTRSGAAVYDVDYAVDGKLEQATFYAEDLEIIPDKE